MTAPGKTVRLMVFLLAAVALGNGARAEHAQPVPMELARTTAWLESLPRAASATVGDTAKMHTRGFGKITPEHAARQAIAAATAASGFAPIDDDLILEFPASRLTTDALTVFRFGQRIDGIPVFGAQVSVLADGNDVLRAVTGAYAAHSDSARWPDTALGETEALSAAVSALTGSAREVGALHDGEIGDFNAYALAPLSSFHSNAPARVRPVWYPSGHGLLPAYQVELSGGRPGRMRPTAKSILISALDGRELRRGELIHDLRRPEPCGDACPRHNFGYRVLSNRRKTPYTDPYGFTNPHPTGAPDASLPSQPAPMHLLYMNNAGISTGDPWLPSEATHTVGNNVDAYFKSIPHEDGNYVLDIFQDWSYPFDEQAGDHRPPLTSPYTFDYAYDVELAPDDYFQHPGAPVQPVPADSGQFNARIVQPFYVTNWLHDLFYDLGFDEAGGNMQMDNVGRGGIDDDPLFVIAAFSNTFAFTPADGVSPAIVLGHNAFSLSNRDVSALDFGVLTHEWAHILIARLSGMPGGFGQQGALHEGTADFVGMFLTVEPRHRDAPPATGDFHGAYAVGAYWNLDYYNPLDDLPPAGTPERPDNTYYHGIRRFPYSASFDINPLTFGHISPENPLPDGFEPFDWKLRSLDNFEIHTAGEVWASALWQCARNILADTPDRGFRNAHRRFLASLVAALKMIPVDATYTDARDAVLMAVRAGNEDEYLRCRSGFAERGLGAGAVSPPRDSEEFREVIEDFTDADPPGLETDVQPAFTSNH